MPSSYEGVLASIPGLGGFLAGQNEVRQRDAATLGQAGQIQGILSSQMVMQEKQRQIAMEQALRTDLSKLTPEQQNDPVTIKGLFMKYASPHDALTSLGKNQLEGLPDIVKLDLFEKRARAAGDTQTADMLKAKIKKDSNPENSAGQEDRQFLIDISEKARKGEPLTPNDRNKANLIYKTMTAPRFDPATGQMSVPNLGAAVDPERNFGQTVRQSFQTDEAAKAFALDQAARGINVAAQGPAPGDASLSALAQAPAAAAPAPEPRMNVTQVAPPKERPAEPLHAIVGPDGKPVLVPRSEALGKTPYVASLANPEEDLTPSGQKIKNDLIRNGLPVPKTRRGQVDNSALNSLGSESDAGARPISVNRADYKANQAALTANTKDLAAIRPYKDMLEQNGDIAIDLAQKAILTDVKFANKSINWLRQNASDNPDVAEFLAQTLIVSTEAARVLNNPRLVGQLTDSARHEMQGIVNGDMPLNSFTRVMRRMQSDGNNRVSAMVKERAGLMRSLEGGNQNETAPAPASSPNDIARAVQQTGQAYEPQKYDYRRGPNGEVQRKAK